MNKRAIKHLSDDELARVRGYLSYLIHEMGLGSNFQMIIRKMSAAEWNEDDEDKTLAGVEVNEKKFTADLFLCSGWESLEDQVKSSSLIHECLHILHKRADMAVYDHLDIDWLPLRMSQAGKELYIREMEMVVDRITRVLAGHLLPWSAAAELLALDSVVVEGEHF